MNNFLYIHQLWGYWAWNLQNWYIYREAFYLNNIYNSNISELFYINYFYYENWFTDDYVTSICSLLYDTYVFDLFNYSIPNIKLYYPEPFIATPSYIHDDIWFIHIVIYQYWLWFFFISLIVFFFISYLIAIRWNNIRFRPSRETRGVSRSKCGDLITATVPVSWASSIIIHESTDAIEFYDGFGSTEMAIGIRAYQWGWEYYYPRNIDLLNWNNTKTQYIGKTLKYPVNSWDDVNKNNFKNFNYLTNIDQHNSISYYLWSNWNNLNKQMLLNTTFNTNKLINTSTTLLITSPKIFNLNKYFISHNSNFLTIYNLYKRFIFQQIHTAQTSIVWNQLILLNSSNLYNLLIDSTIYNNINRIINYINILDNGWFMWDNFFFINKLNSLFLNKFTDIWTIAVINNNNSSNKSKFYYELNIYNQWIKLNSLLFNLFAEQDFKQWISHDLLEDIIWDLFFIHKYYYKIYNSKNDSIIFNFENLNYNKELKLSENEFFKDFSNYEQMYNIPIIFNTIWNLNYYNKLHFINNMNVCNWFIDVFEFSFNKFKWNQYWIWIYNSNYISTILLYTHIISLYELLYTYFELNTNNWILHDNYILNNNSKKLNYNLNTNWVVLSKLFNITNNSFWKIFKSSFQDERTLFNFKIFSNSSITLPYNTNQLLLLNSIQKNSLIFFMPLAIKNNLNYQINQNNLDSIWNNFSNIFPFLVSTESDIIRYIWFDWYTIRSCIITKSIDTSLYNLNGALNLNYNYTKKTVFNLINKTENFFIKYMHARKLYIPLFVYSPYYYNQILKINNFNKFLLLFDNNIRYWNLQYNFLFLSLWVDSEFAFLDLFYYFNNNLSFLSSNIHGFSLITSMLNCIDQITQLNDILVKRNYLLLYLNYQLNNFYIPLSYQLTMKNPLLQLFKYTINQLNLHTMSIKNSYHNLSIESILKVYLNNHKPLELIMNNQYENAILNNPYQSLKKGITNMIRIHADKAVAMPIDTRLQLLAVSKDIIHSWAIPSAGIKIDCIPGYSSHRIAIFLLSGIYWGQCMEICGRFHHWMPIVVYFIRRDLFCIWCIHFIFINKQINMVNQSFDSYLNFSSSVVMIPHNYWLYEL